jgi:hypothetical protein
LFTRRWMCSREGKATGAKYVQWEWTTRAIVGEVGGERPL